MSNDHYHLAQANIARGRGPITDPVMQGFVDQLDYINSVADRSPGFVWRLQTEDGDATSIQAFDDPLIILNMSVWESVEALYAYVFQSDHQGPMRARREWFTRLDRPHSVLWWVARGERPDPLEARRRLDLLRDEGPTPDAFTFGRLYASDGRLMERNPGIDRECGV